MKKITSGKMYYIDGVKYILRKPWTAKTNIQLPKTTKYKNIALNKNGLLTLTPGFPWDGPSGPTRDTPNSLAASAAHDALYRLIRHGLLSRKFRKNADVLFYDILREKRMSLTRANLWYQAVRRFAKSSSQAASKKKVLVAP